VVHEGISFKATASAKGTRVKSPSTCPSLDQLPSCAIARDRRHRQHHRPFAALFSKAALVQTLRQKRELYEG